MASLSSVSPESRYKDLIHLSNSGDATFVNDIILPQDGVVAFNSTSDEYITASADHLFFGTGNLSRLTIFASSYLFKKYFMKFEPINPQPPVTKILSI